jgi:hypothetical protein
MLRRANAHLILEDHRSSTIDACCAAEVALSAAVIETIKTERCLSDNEAKKFVRGAHGVVDVFRLHLAARGSAVSEGQVKFELAGPRNKAAHDGEEPTRDVTVAALAVAKQLISEATPLQTAIEVRRLARRAL